MESNLELRHIEAIALDPYLTIEARNQKLFILIQSNLNNTQNANHLSSLLLNTILNTQTDTDENSIKKASAAITVLNYMGFDFKKRDFSKIQIPNADLSQANLTSITLENSNCQNVNFEGAILNKANLSNTNLKNAKFGSVSTILIGHTDFLYSAVISPNGKMMASGGRDQNLKIWDLATMKCTQYERKSANSIYSIAFSSDNNLLAMVGQSNSIQLFTVDQINNKISFCEEIKNAHNEVINYVKFSHDNEFLYTCSSDSSVKRFCVLSTDQQISFYPLETDSAFQFCFIQNNSVLAVGYKNGRVVFLNSNNLSLKGKFGIKKHSDAVYSMASSENGKYFASGSKDGQITLWNQINLQAIIMLNIHSHCVSSLQFIMNDSQLMSGGVDRKVKFFHLKEMKESLQKLELPTRVWSANYSKTANLIAIVGEDYKLHLFNAQTSEKQNLFQIHSRISALAVDQNQKQIAFGSADGSIQLCDSKDLKVLAPLRGHTASISDLKYHPRYSILISGSLDQNVRVWDTMHFTCLKVLTQHSQRISCLNFSTDGSQFVTASFDNTMNIWNCDVFGGKFTLEQTLPDHFRHVRDIIFSHNNNFMVSGSYNGQIKVWQKKKANNAQFQCKITKQLMNTVCSFSFIDESDILVTSASKYIQLWSCAKKFQLIKSINVKKAYGHSAIDYVKCITGFKIVVQPSMFSKILVVNCLNANTLAFIDPNSQKISGRVYDQQTQTLTIAADYGVIVYNFANVQKIEGRKYKGMLECGKLNIDGSQIESVHDMSMLKSFGVKVSK